MGQTEKQTIWGLTGKETESELENQMEDGRLRVEVKKLGVTEKVQARELMRTWKRALIDQGDQILWEGRNMGTRKTNTIYSKLWLKG